MAERIQYYRLTDDLGLVGFILGAVMLVAALAGAAVMLNVSGSTVVVVVSAVMVLLLAAQIVFDLGAARRAGDVLVDLGPPPDRRARFVMHVMSFIGAGVLVGVSLLGSAPLVERVALAVLWCCIPLSNVAWSSKPRRLCTNAMRFRGRLVPWSRVVAYDWIRPGATVLFVRYRWMGLLRASDVMQVPIDARATIDARLRAHGLTPLRERAAATAGGA